MCGSGYYLDDSLSMATGVTSAAVSDLCSGLVDHGVMVQLTEREYYPSLEDPAASDDLKALIPQCREDDDHHQMHDLAAKSHEDAFEVANF
jgi:hypothetical protein